MQQCKICQGFWPKLEGHHVLPREYNGENGPIVDICANCHGGLHAQAKHWASGRDEFQFFPPDVMERAKPFVQLIMQAQQRFERLQAQGGGPPPPPKLLTVRLHDPNVLRKLHILKADRGYNSLEKFLNDLLSRMVARL